MAEGMRIYRMRDGREAWYWPEEAPAGAEEVKAQEPQPKAKAPANKARTSTATK